MEVVQLGYSVIDSEHYHYAGKLEHIHDCSSSVLVGWIGSCECMN